MRNRRISASFACHCGVSRLRPPKIYANLEENLHLPVNWNPLASWSSAGGWPRWSTPSICRASALVGKLGCEGVIALEGSVFIPDADEDPAWVFYDETGGCNEPDGRLLELIVQPSERSPDPENSCAFILVMQVKASLEQLCPNRSL